MADEHRDGAPAGDELPTELDVTAYVGPYVFPNTDRRRIAAGLYLVIAAGAAVAGLASDNRGLLGGALLLAAIAVYQWSAAWDLAVDQTDALAVASRTVGFPVGHSSAQLGWRGLRSRPSWRILLYSADEPPSMRGLVEVDGVDGEVLGEYLEQNPEDWSQYGIGASTGRDREAP